MHLFSCLACAVLIGCLPTYTQAGLAAPILLSLLRLVQGIAVGGELGTAVVFMHELAPAGGKTKGGSVVFLGVSEHKGHPAGSTEGAALQAVQ